MHLEKNVIKSTIGVLLDIKTQTKDGLKSRLDLVNQDIRHEIHPTPAAQGGNKVDLPGASFCHYTTTYYTTTHTIPTTPILLLLLLLLLYYYYYTCTMLALLLL
jgi:predicted RND superfamily exporter protein